MVRGSGYQKQEKEREKAGHALCATQAEGGRLKKSPLISPSFLSPSPYESDRSPPPSLSAAVGRCSVWTTNSRKQHRTQVSEMGAEMEEASPTTATMGTDDQDQGERDHRHKGRRGETNSKAHTQNTNKGRRKKRNCCCLSPQLSSEIALTRERGKKREGGGERWVSSPR